MHTIALWHLVRQMFEGLHGEYERRIRAASEVRTYGDGHHHNHDDDGGAMNHVAPDTQGDAGNQDTAEDTADTADDAVIANIAPGSRPR